MRKATSAPPLTARLPPSQKSFCTSTTIRALAMRPPFATTVVGRPRIVRTSRSGNRAGAAIRPCHDVSMHAEGSEAGFSRREVLIGAGGLALLAGAGGVGYALAPA